MKKGIVLLVAALLLATPFKADAALQCVTYARDISGINLKGDAWQWWTAAHGVYDRGQAPREGGVLVFSRQGSMRYGHVSVVRRVVSNRMVLVDHANWAPSRSAGRGKVAEAVPVLDISPRNDWTQVRVWYRPANDYGSRLYRTEGFVYRPGGSIRRAGLQAGEGRSLIRPAVIHVDLPNRAEPARIEPVKVEPVKVEAAKPVEPAPAPVLKQAKDEEPKAEGSRMVEAKKTDDVPQAAPAEPRRPFDLRDWAEQAMADPSAGTLVTVARHDFRRRMPVHLAAAASDRAAAFN